MSNVDYKGSVTLISGLTQANNSSFPLVDGDAVQYKQEINEDGTFKSVSQKLSEFNRSYEYATSDDIDGILNGLFGQYKRLSLTGDTMLEHTFEDQLKILSVNGNSYQPTSNNIVPTPEKSIPIISKKTNIKRISPNIFDLEKESDTSKIPDSGTYRSIGQHQLKPNTKYVFSWSGATVPAKATLSFQIQDDKGTVLVSPFTYFNLESDEKEEAGKEVEFTTNSSGIVKFAYNCTVGTSNTKETYQQYWYTKILRDIVLKESVPESELVELRSLKESKNVFSLEWLLFQEEKTWELNAAYGLAKTIILKLKPNTQYIASTNAIGDIGGDAGKNRSLYFSGVNDPTISAGDCAIFDGHNIIKRSDANGELRITLFTPRENAQQFINKEVWVQIEEGSVATAYVPATVRDYKIVNHQNKTAKIIRNINQFEIPTDISWDYTLWYPTITANVIPTDIKGDFASRDYSLLTHTTYRYLTYSNNSGQYLGFNECDTYWNFKNSNDVNTWLSKKKSEGNPLIFQYQLATPIEEEIVYSETDTTEAGFSHQDNTSPSINVPSQTKSVDKIDITVAGKNLFDVESAKNKENWVSSIKQIGYICFMMKVKKGSRYTFSYRDKLDLGLNFYAGIVNAEDILNTNTTDWIYHSTSSNLINNCATFISKSDFIALMVNNGGFDLMFKYLQNIQLEVGDIVTDYEPYKPPQFLSYQLATPLKGINNTKDIIDIEFNQRTDNLTTFVLDDKTIKSIILETTKEKTQVFQLGISDIFNNNDIWCDKLKNDSNKDEELFTCQSGELYIAIYKGRLETVDVDGFKKWLKDNPLTFTGSATTPTQEALPEDLPTELNKLKTNDGSTAIYINGEVKPSLNIEYKGT